MTWDHEIDVRDVWKTKNVQLIATTVAAKLKELPLSTHDGDLLALISALENMTNDVAIFDQLWEKVYDWAERRRVWITCRG